MPARISMKNLIFILLGGFACAVGIVFLFDFLLAGPRLGAHYDFLLRYKQPVVTGEILIIETEEYIESNDIYTVLLTLAEMEAETFIMAGRMMPASSPITVTETELRRRFVDEYSLLGSNIRNLFEAIRLGFVAPRDAPAFVEQVVDLAEQGRDRLIMALIERDEDLLRSVAVFGNFIEANTRLRLDMDGRLRRVKLLDENIEHPVFSNLKSRYVISQIESHGHERFLWLRRHDGKDLDISLDRDGNVITPWNAALRRVGIELFREYRETENNMHSALEQANELRAFSQTSPDQIPLFLADNARMHLEELLMSPNSENRNEWIASRVNYFRNLEGFLNSPAEMLLVNGYEEQIASLDPANEEQVASLIGARNELIASFTSMRETYVKLSSLHAKLKNELVMSFCIMGPWPNADYSALLANALITGSHVKPVSKWYLIFWSVLASTVVLLVVFVLRPFFLLSFGFLLSLFAAVVFCGVFIFSSYWIDPLIIFGASLVGTLVMFFCKCAYLNYRARTFRMAYRTAVSKDVLRNLITTGKPRLSEVNVSSSVVLAIKDTNLLSMENQEKSQNAGKARKAFYTMAKKEVFNAGAVIAGFEGDTILVCFGSPLVKTDSPAGDAFAFVWQLMKNDKISWRFGIDAGECTFSWSPETGYSVSGRPAIRARILVSRTVRYNLRGLVTDVVQKTINLPAKKIGTLFDVKDSFFEIPKSPVN